MHLEAISMLVIFVTYRIGLSKPRESKAVYAWWNRHIELHSIFDDSSTTNEIHSSSNTYKYEARHEQITDKSDEIDAIHLPKTRLASVSFMKRLNEPCTSLTQKSHNKINTTVNPEYHIVTRYIF